MHLRNHCENVKVSKGVRGKSCSTLPRSPFRFQHRGPVGDSG